MTLVCVECGKIIDDKDIKGSMKHPYCKKCFKKVWNNDYNVYFRFLEKTHL